MSNIRRWAVSGVAAAAVVVVSAAAAWACIAGPTLNLTPGQARPGGEVALSGFSYKSEIPIVVRFNALDGPVLGSFMPAGGRFGDDEILSAKVTIPPDTKPGSYVLIATQSNTDGTLANIPVRALITVTGQGGAPVVGAPVATQELGRSVGPVTTKSSTSMATLVLVSIGVAGLALLVAGLATAWSGRRGTSPEAARVR
ncbi:MAG: hypothetical protein ACRD12_21045 [Acidimicrobiales bacterium]